MHLELVWVRVLISCGPVVGVLRFFFSWNSSSFPQRGNVTPCSAVVVQITSFLPSARGLEFLLFDGSTGTLLQSW
jgi:hypothetical protein